MTAVTKLKPFQKDCGPEHQLDQNTRESMIRNGKVLSISSHDIRVRTAGETVSAQKAFSCFAEPLPGDRVICTEDETGQVYILGIIQRESNQNLVLSYPASTDMVCKGEHLNLRSEKTMSLASKELSLFSQKALHKAKEAVIAYDDSTAVGTSFAASINTVKFVSRMIHAMARQMIGSFQGYIRTTEDNDQVRAGQMMRKADGLYTMDSQYTLMNSKKDTKIDGERIHMG